MLLVLVLVLLVLLLCTVGLKAGAAASGPRPIGWHAVGGWLRSSQPKHVHQSRRQPGKELAWQVCRHLLALLLICPGLQLVLRQLRCLPCQHLQRMLHLLCMQLQRMLHQMCMLHCLLGRHSHRSLCSHLALLLPPLRHQRHLLLSRRRVLRAICCHLLQLLQPVCILHPAPGRLHAAAAGDGAAAGAATALAEHPQQGGQQLPAGAAAGALAQGSLQPLPRLLQLLQLCIIQEPHRLHLALALPAFDCTRVWDKAVRVKTLLHVLQGSGSQEGAGSQASKPAARFARSGPAVPQSAARRCCCKRSLGGGALPLCCGPVRMSLQHSNTDMPIYS